MVGRVSDSTAWGGTYPTHGSMANFFLFRQVLPAVAGWT
jgi:hypothetical protein